MDTSTLLAFLSVSRHRSFSAAASELHLTQPAISKRIALLEDELGVKLFDRIGRSVGLTEYGRQLVPRAKDILQRIENTKRELFTASQEIAGPLSLAISHHIGLHRLPPVLKVFSNTYPKVKLDIQFTDSELAYSQVLRGEIELAVTTLAPNEDPQILSQEVWPDPLCCAAAVDHPLSKLRKLTVTQLSKYPAILPGQNTYTGVIITKLFARHGLSLDIAMVTNYMETIKTMSSIGLGWTIIPESMLDNSLIKLPIKDLNIHRRLGYIHHRSRQLSNAAAAFIETLNAQ